MLTRPISTTVALLALTTALAACGSNKDGSGGGAVQLDGKSPARVQMQDIKFDVTSFSVVAGTTVQFDFTNAGKVPHDAFIGDAAAQADHETEMAAMASNGDMAHHSMDESAITVQPGASGTLTYTFTTPGTYEIGCHQPGHYAAGMKATITVS